MNKGIAVAAFAATVFAVGVVRADEEMSLFNGVPAEWLGQKYGFSRTGPGWTG